VFTPLERAVIAAVKNRFKPYFDAKAKQFGDLAKRVGALNKNRSPHVRPTMVGDEAVIQCKTRP